MRAACFLGTALMMASGSWSADEHPKLILRVCDFAAIRASDLAGAVAETSRIFPAAGIELIRTETDPAAPATVRSVVVASIVSSAGADFPGSVLGRALPFSVSGGRVTIFLDNIRVRATQAGLPLPILLGHALAPVLGHVMLGAGAHRSPRLVRAQSGRIRHGGLQFSQAQAVALRCTITGLAVDDSGSVFFEELAPSARRIRRLSPDGTVTTTAGMDAPGHSGDDGPAVQAHLNPTSGEVGNALAPDSSVNLYVTDGANKYETQKMDLGLPTVDTRTRSCVQEIE